MEKIIWLLLFFGGLCMVPDISWWALDACSCFMVGCGRFPSFHGSWHNNTGPVLDVADYNILPGTSHNMSQWTVFTHDVH